MMKWLVRCDAMLLTEESELKTSDRLVGYLRSRIVAELVLPNSSVSTNRVDDMPSTVSMCSSRVRDVHVAQARVRIFGALHTAQRSCRWYQCVSE